MSLYLNNNFPVIRNDEPYQGYIYTTANDRDGLIMAYSKGLSFHDYNKSNDGKFKLVTWADIEALDSVYIASRVTSPVEITKEEFFDMLEVLPPCRWHNAGGYEVFHISERITSNLVTWAAHSGNKYYCFDDLDDISDNQIRDKFK